MKYYEFEFLETKENQETIRSNGLYYTSAEANTVEIIMVASSIVNDPKATIKIEIVNEIDRKTFISKGGNPNVF